MSANPALPQENLPVGPGIATPSSTKAVQRVVKVRRDYNSWVAKETMEDYALRFTPRSFRKWSSLRVANTAFGQMVRATPCDRCHGDGRIPEEPCKVCSGLGRKHTEKKHRIDIPAGIESGQRIRISGAGHAGETGAPPGDLYVEVHVAEREGMVRDGQDLITVIPVDATAAMIGDTIEVTTLDGEDEIELAPGTQPGAETSLKGKGLPRLGSSRRRGEHRFIFNVVIPGELSEEQKRLATELDESLTDANRAPKESGIFSRMRRAFG